MGANSVPEPQALKVNPPQAKSAKKTSYEIYDFS
jgi:hypothetical protein